MTATGRQYRRSPHLLVQWQGHDLVLIACDRVRRFRVDERLLGLLRLMDQWTDVDDLAAAGHAVSENELAELAQLGVLEQCTGSPSATEPTGDEQHCWDALSLAIQRRQTPGGAPNRDGATRGYPPPPATKPRPPGETSPLPAAAALAQPLSDLLDERRSIRTYGAGPLPLTDLATLLFHAARVQHAWHHDEAGGQALRPFASAGARNELELYVVANDVDGLRSGAHYYDAHAHELVLVAPRDAHQERLNGFVHDATGGALNREPHAVLLVTAVFARTLWKYGEFGIKLIYTDTGCLYQTVYLVATNLHLAPCAIGAGEELANAQWLGLDPLVESQVGCFLVGTRQ